ncbi:unnamed protein product [Notodromas monacha]|uniref:Uncharacterized protein n=1 Tax=Notodromas monacha TaxID=399045 RepID=A0A7R9GFY6_9CRUS|nr:unnamed protein product [Notodromas monacha]CAG0921272.1 unnamed protein product [Notodromas monacha]
MSPSFAVGRDMYVGSQPGTSVLHHHQSSVGSSSIYSSEAAVVGRSEQSQQEDRRCREDTHIHKKRRLERGAYPCSCDDCSTNGHRLNVLADSNHRVSERDSHHAYSSHHERRPTRPRKRTNGANPVRVYGDTRLLHSLSGIWLNRLESRSPRFRACRSCRSGAALLDEKS